MPEHTYKKEDYMKKQFKGEVTRIIDGEMCVMYVSEIEQAFEVYYGEVDSDCVIGAEYFFTVKYFGAHNLGEYAAWI